MGPWHFAWRPVSSGHMVFPRPVRMQTARLLFVCPAGPRESRVAQGVPHVAPLRSVAASPTSGSATAPVWALRRSQASALGLSWRVSVAFWLKALCGLAPIRNYRRQAISSRTARNGIQFPGFADSGEDAGLGQAGGCPLLAPLEPQAALHLPAQRVIGTLGSSTLLPRPASVCCRLAG